MRKPRTSRRFRKDYAKLARSGRRDMGKLDGLLEKLILGESLHASHKDHPLGGEWIGYRDCHVEGDWVLVYSIERDERGFEWITFHATDNHSNLFN